MAWKRDESHRWTAGTKGQERYIFEALEPRLLLSADPLGALVGGGLAVELVDEQVARELDDADVLDALLYPPSHQLELAASDTADPTSSPGTPRLVDLEALARLSNTESRSADPLNGAGTGHAVAAEAEWASSREILFADARTPDYQRLLDGLGDGPGGRAFEVFILDPDRDGIEQISEVLAGQSQVDAVHLVSHGTQGGVQLGATWLTKETLSEYAGALQGWQDALADEADLLVYGCKLAANEDGQALVYTLGELTGADIAASVDSTGHETLDGDWDLEHSSGMIETRIPFSVRSRQDWSGLLAVITVDTANDSNDGGDTTSIASLIATPGGDGISLREAMIAANNTPNGGTPDEIHFDIIGAGPHTIAPLSALPTVNDPVVIDATTEPDFTVTPIVALDGSSAGASANGFNITAGSSTIRGFAIYGFGDDGIELNTGGNNLIEGNHIGTGVNGTEDFGNLDDGIDIKNSANNIVGGVTTAARNIISDNHDEGISITGAGSTGNLVQGNYIGTDLTGTVAVGNSSNGVKILNGAGNNTIGGTAAGAGNVISANEDGIEIQGSTCTGNVIQGNHIGTDAAGAAALGNTDVGVFVEGAADNLVGGTTPAARNIISANASGVVVAGTSATGNRIQGNYIGTDVTGAIALGNTREGVLITDSAEAASGGSSGNLVGGSNGGGNTIANSGSVGVRVLSGTGNAIRGNSIYSNALIGIDLGTAGTPAPNDPADDDTGPNELQNFPVLASAAVTGADLAINGTLNSTASTSFDIDFFSGTAADPSGHGEGEIYLGSTTVVTDPNGNASFHVTFPGAGVAVGEVISATATGPAGDTSEFSESKVANANNAPIAANSFVSTEEDIGYTFVGIDFSFSDSDGDSMAKVQITALPTNGALRLSGLDVTLNQEIDATGITAGELKFFPAANANGAAYDSFQFKVHDGFAYSTAAHAMNVDVTPVNDPPTANDDSATVNEDSGANAIDVLANDSFAPDVGETLIISAVTQGADGTVTITGGGSGLSYMPAGDFFGSDSFTYTIDDGNGGVATAKLTVAVTGIDDAPTAINLSGANVDEQTDTSFGYSIGTVSATDPDTGDTLSYSIVGGADAGKFSIGGAGGNELILNDGVLDPERQGTYEVMVRVTDAAGLTRDGTFTITVNTLDRALVGTLGPPPADIPPPPEAESGPSELPPTDKSESDASDEQETGAPAQEISTGSGGPGGGEAAGDEEAEADIAPAEDLPAALFVGGELGVTGKEPPKATIESVIEAISIRAPILDLVLGEMAVPGVLGDGPFSFGAPAALVQTGDLLNELTDLREDIAEDISFHKTVVGSTIVASTGLSIGYVMWLVRGGVLMSGVLSSIPAWRLVDPLPVLAHVNDRPEEDEADESLESLVKKPHPRAEIEH